MATNFRYTSKRLPVASASGPITTSALVVQEGIFGIAQTSVGTGGSLWLGTEGVWNVPVPVSTVKGDVLYAPGSPLTVSTGVTLSRSGAGATPIGVAVSSRDALGNALVCLYAMGAAVGGSGAGTRGPGSHS